MLIRNINLSPNAILDINILENANFKELKELYLFHIEITYISVLEKVKLNKLEKLCLYNNDTKDIKELENFVFRN